METNHDIFVPEDILEKVKDATSNSIPARSKHIYEKELRSFDGWRKERNIHDVNEDIMLAYFFSFANTITAASLWSKYSMLKSTLKVYENTDISRFAKLIAFLKLQSKTYKPKKSKTLQKQQIEQFLLEAPDNKYLMMKVALLVGIFGACRCDELVKMTIDDIHDKGSYLYISLPDTKTNKPRSFTIIGEGYGVNAINIYKKYAQLRPINVGNRRFFLNYKKGKCTIQPVGVNSLAKIPRLIATYLKLPEPESYTGHCFRRSSASLLVNTGAALTTLKCHSSWKPSSMAEEFIEDSESYKIRIAEKMIGGETSQKISNAVNVQMNIGIPSSDFVQIDGQGMIKDENPDLITEETSISGNSDPLLEDNAGGCIEETPISQLLTNHKKHNSDYLATQLLKETSECTAHKDDYSSFSKFIESELREIKNKRRLAILRKKIQDVIFEAKMEEMDEIESDCSSATVNLVSVASTSRDSLLGHSIY